MANTTTGTFQFIKPEVGADGGLWGTHWNQNADALDTFLGKPRVPYVTPTVGATTTCDLSLGMVFAFTVSQATTLAFTNVPASTFKVEILLKVTNGAAFTLSYPASVTHLRGAVPTLQASGVDFLSLVTYDAGTTWYLDHVGKNLTLSGVLKSGVGTSTSQAKPSQVLFQTGGQTTTSTSEVSLVSYSLPANALNADRQAVIMTAEGTAATQTCTFKLKFGATGLVAIGPTAGQWFYAQATVVRTGAATQFAITFFTANGAATTSSKTVPTETLSGAVTVDFRGFVTAGGTLTLEYGEVDYLGA
jgi:hypothetical protein